MLIPINLKCFLCSLNSDKPMKWSFWILPQKIIYDSPMVVQKHTMNISIFVLSD